MSRLDSMEIDGQIKAFIRECAFEAAETTVRRAEELHKAQIAAQFAEHERDCPVRGIRIQETVAANITSHEANCPGRPAGKAWAAGSALLAGIVASVISAAAIAWFLSRKAGG